MWRLAALLAVSLAILGSGSARAVPIDLNNFFADLTVTVAADGSSAVLAEDASISPVLLSNDPGLGDPNVIIPGAGVTLFFDFMFSEAAGEDDEFFVFLLDAATGFSVGPAFEFLTQTTSSGTVGFDLSSLTALTLGLQFELGALPGDSGTGSRLTISNVRLVEASVDIAEPGTLALMMAGLLLLTLTARASRRTGEVG